LIGTGKFASCQEFVFLQKVRYKRFFSGVHACVHGADAPTNFT